MKPKSTLREFFLAAGSSLLAVSSASAVDYTWGGGNLLWNNTSAAGWNGGPPLTADTATINSGTATFAGSDTYGSAISTASAAITINTGGTVASGGNFNTLWNLTLGGGTLLSNGGVNADFPTYNLAGTVTAAANVTSSISTGTGSNNIINLGNGGTSAVTNTTFNVGAAGTLNVGTVLQNHRYFNAGTFESVAGLIKTGAGVMNLNASNTYTGNTVVTAGTLAINGSYNVAAGGTASQLRIGFDGTSGAVTIGTGAGIVNFGGDGYGSAALVGVGNSAAAGSNGSLAVNGGTVNLLGTAGNGATALNIGGQFNATAGTGIVTVNGGALNIGSRILMGFNNASSNGTLTIAGGTVTLGTNKGGNAYGVGSGSNPGNILMGAGTTVVNLNSGTLNVFQFQAGAAASRTINFNGGTLKALGTPNFFFGNNGASGATVSAQSTLFTTTVNAGGAIIDTNTFNITIPTALAAGTGSGGLTKLNTGILTLSGTNTYTGATNIDGGTLALSATGSINNTSGVDLGGGTFDVSAKVGGYAVNNLTGVGNVVGALTVSTSLAIGNSPGTVSFESLTLGAASTFAYEFDGGTNLADLGLVSDALSLGNADLSLLQLGTYTPNDKYTLFGYETGNLTGTFAGLADGDLTNDNLGGTWQINYDDTTAGLNGGTGTSFVTITAIPEPSAGLLVGLGLLGLLRRRR